MADLPRRQLRRFLLKRQGLWPPRAVRGKKGALETVRRLRCLQYDSIDVLGRNHEIALSARVGGFRRRHLHELLYTDRLLVDGWDKQMSIGPVEERRYFAPERQDLDKHHRFREDGPLKDIFPFVRKELMERGPLCSLDIEDDRKADWSWAPTRAVRAALEALWFRGELSIQRREGSRRYYDFTERLLPDGYSDPTAPPGEDNSREYLKWRVRRRIASAGALSAKAGDGWLGIDGGTAARRRVIAELVDEGELVPMSIEGFNEPLYRPAGDDDIFLEVTGNPPPPPRASVLAPLDNLLWDRKLIRNAFDFDYVWEVYKPRSERRWGYYVLPVLYGDRFIARFEPGRDRKTGTLVVKNWWTEPGIRVSDAMAAAVTVSLSSLAAMDGLKNIAFDTGSVKDELSRKCETLLFRPVSGYPDSC